MHSVFWEAANWTTNSCLEEGVACISIPAAVAVPKETGKKLDGDKVACEVRCALGPDGVRLFKVSEFLTTQQISSYFPHCAAKICQQLPKWCWYHGKQRRRQLCFSKGNCKGHCTPASDDVWSIWYLCHGQGWITGAIKLSMLQSICRKLELEVPPKPIPRKRIYNVLGLTWKSHDQLHLPWAHWLKFGVLWQAILAL